MRKGLLTTGFLVVLHAAAMRAQNGLVLNQQYGNGQGAGAQTYLIATLWPSNNAGVADHLHLVATFNCNAYSDCNSTIDATFGNRGGFMGVYTMKGAYQGNVHITAYAQADGTTNIYLMMADYWDEASYSVLEQVQDTVYQSPVDIGAATPPGTLVFDTASPAYPPANYTDFSGDFYPSGAIGIGTTNPADALHVNLGPASETDNGILITGASSFFGDIGMKIQNTGAGGNLWYLDSTANGSGYGPGKLAFVDGVGSYPTMVVTPGSVGIGTTNPTAAFEVNGSAKVDGPVSVSSVSFPDGSSLSSAASANPLGLPAGTASVMAQANGNIGIGTGNPQAALEIAGFSQYTPPVGITLHNTSGEAQSLSLTQILFEGGSAGDGAGVQPFGKIISGGTDWDSSNGFMGFQTSTSGILSERMRITPNGSVGIGTSNPGATLEVNGSAKIDGAMSVSSVSFPDGSSLSTANGSGPTIVQSNGNTTVNGVLQVSGNTNPNTSIQGGYFGWNALTGGTGETDFINNEGYGSGAFAFFNTPLSGSPRNLLMYMNGNGNVGIGTRNPGAMLEVNGSAKIDGAMSVSSLGFPDGTVQSSAWTGGSFLSGLSVGSSGGSSNYMQLNTNGGSPSYIGNVANSQSDWSYNTYFNGSQWVYATTNPSSAIRMAADYGMITFYTTPVGSAGQSNSSMDSTGPKMSLSLDGGLSLGNSYVTSRANPGPGGLIVAGNVGIGTPTPGARLEVNGSAKIDGAMSVSSLGFPDGTSLSTASGLGSSITQSGGTTTVNGALAVASSGNVGIGTSSLPSVLTIANPAADGAGTWANGILFVDTLIGGSNQWAHAAIYTSGSTGYNGDLVFATDGDYQQDINPTEKLRIKANGSVGIGTSTPGATLEVNGSAKIDGAMSVSSLGFPDGTSLSTASGLGSSITQSGGITKVNGALGVTGDLGIGSPTPISLLDVLDPGAGPNAPAGVFRDAVVPAFANNADALLTVRGTGSSASTWRGRITAGGDNVEMLFGEYNNQGWLGAHNAQLNAWADLHINPEAGVGTKVYIGAYGSRANGILTVDSSTGNVGIQTTTPGSDLASLSSPPSAGTPIFEVNGDIALTQNTTAQHAGGSFIFSDGTVQSTAWRGVLSGGDYAESVNISGDRSGYAPGDLIAMDADNPGKFLKSSGPYSTLIAGIYSTKPGLLGRRQKEEPQQETDEIPMAMVGIVPTKVTTENGPIKVGDLLVSSSVPGVAMKGTDPARMMGAVVGKAMAGLSSDTGVIEVLVRLQ